MVAHTLLQDKEEEIAELQASLMNLVTEVSEQKTQMQRHTSDSQRSMVKQMEVALHQAQEVCELLP
jgi:hypothetical protein